MKSRKITAFILACLFILVCLPTAVSADDTSQQASVESSEETSEASSEETSGVEKPEITSGNLVVIRSVDTGQILLNSSGDTKVSPTVSAKLVAAMVIYDSVTSLDESVTVPAEATLAKNIGSYGDLSAPMLGLTIGNTLTVRQLMTATLVSAANDACYTLAYYVSGGDIASFVAKMNEKAASVGCTGTKYTNPVGLNDGESYTTPVDVSLVAAAFYKYNTLLEISSQTSYVLGNTIHTKNYLLSSMLLSGYTKSGARGMIAGQARNDGGYCLITSAEKSGLGYVFVVMEAPGEVRNKDGTRSFPENNAYSDIHKVFDWAISSFGYITLVTEREIIGEIPVSIATDNTDHVNYVALEEVDILMPVGAKAEDVTRDIDIYYETLEAPVEKDKVVGQMDLYYEGEKIASVTLVTNAEADRSRILSLFGKLKSLVKSPTMKTVIKVLIIGLIAYFILVIACQIYRVIIKANAAAKKRAKRAEARKKAEDKIKSGAKQIEKPKNVNEEKRKDE